MKIKQKNVDLSILLYFSIRVLDLLKIAVQPKQALYLAFLKVS